MSIAERIQSLTGSPDTWPLEAHTFIIAFAAMLVAKTSFSPDEIASETAKFMDAAASFSSEITENFRSGMTAENWPAMLSSVIAYMHKEANPETPTPDQDGADYLRRMNSCILEENRDLNA